MSRSLFVVFIFVNIQQHTTSATVGKVEMVWGKHIRIASPLADLVGAKALSGEKGAEDLGQDAGASIARRATAASGQGAGSSVVDKNVAASGLTLGLLWLQRHCRARRALQLQVRVLGPRLPGERTVAASGQGAGSPAAEKTVVAPGPGAGPSLVVAAISGQAAEALCAAVVACDAEKLEATRGQELGSVLDNREDGFSDVSSGYVNTVRSLGMAGRHRIGVLLDFKELI